MAHRRRQRGGDRAAWMMLAGPALLGMAGLLVLPGLWGALLLAGYAVPNADRPDARTMAVAMLVAWPIAAVLAVLAGFAWRAGRRR